MFDNDHERSFNLLLERRSNQVFRFFERGEKGFGPKKVENHFRALVQINPYKTVKYMLKDMDDHELRKALVSKRLKESEWARTSKQKKLETLKAKELEMKS